MEYLKKNPQYVKLTKEAVRFKAMSAFRRP